MYLDERHFSKYFDRLAQIIEHRRALEAVG